MVWRKKNRYQKFYNLPSQLSFPRNLFFLYQIENHNWSYMEVPAHRFPHKQNGKEQVPVRWQNWILGGTGKIKGLFSGLCFFAYTAILVNRYIKISRNLISVTSAKECFYPDFILSIFISCFIKLIFRYLSIYNKCFNLGFWHSIKNDLFSLKASYHLLWKHYLPQNLSIALWFCVLDT